jgi:hypothetical protein
MGSGCNEGCGERDYDLWKTKESLHHCCLNDGRDRLPMCLIRRGVVTRDHTSREKGVEAKYSRAGSHEAGRLQTRLVDMDFAANLSHLGADRAGGVPVPCYGMLNHVAWEHRMAWMCCRACCMKGPGPQGKNGTRSLGEHR